MKKSKQTTEQRWAEYKHIHADDIKRINKLNEGLTEQEQSLKLYVEGIAMNKYLIGDCDLQNEQVNILLKIISFLKPPEKGFIKLLKENKII